MVERNRRKRVLQFVEEGLSQRQIAEKLVVSERTTKRGVTKIKSYQERVFRHQLSLLQMETEKNFEGEMAGKTPRDQLRALRKIMTDRNKLLQALKMREYYRHQIYVSIDLDKVAYGFPEIRVWPQSTKATFKTPLTINFRYIRNKKAIPFSNMTLSNKS